VVRMGPLSSKRVSGILDALAWQSVQWNLRIPNVA
jgi:hypothetical protein